MHAPKGLYEIGATVVTEHGNATVTAIGLRPYVKDGVVGINYYITGIDDPDVLDALAIDREAFRAALPARRQERERLRKTPPDLLSEPDRTALAALLASQEISNAYKVRAKAELARILSRRSDTRTPEERAFLAKAEAKRLARNEKQNARRKAARAAARAAAPAQPPRTASAKAAEYRRIISADPATLTEAELARRNAWKVAISDGTARGMAYAGKKLRRRDTAVTPAVAPVIRPAEALNAAWFDYCNGWLVTNEARAIRGQYADEAAALQHVATGAVQPGNKHR